MQDAASQHADQPDTARRPWVTPRVVRLDGKETEAVNTVFYPSEGFIHVATSTLVYFGPLS